jgi:molecular chaperone GrpE
MPHGTINDPDQTQDPPTGAGNHQNSHAGSEGGATTVENLQSKLNEEKERADKYLAQWQRASADYQNYKRRTELEREEYALLANKALIINLLPAVDDLNRAIASVDQSLEGNGWVEGIRNIQRKLSGALEASGVSEFHAEGETFDPNVHEAISQAPGEHDKVVAEVRSGYKLGSRVLRPAMVVVGNGEPVPGTSEE